MRTLVSIQYLRALAAASVVLYHTLLQVLAIGPDEPFELYVFASGVDVFFVISGFIMWSTTHDIERGSLTFLKARIIRVVPLYWLALAMFLVVIFIQDGYTASHFPGPDEIAKSYLFIPYVDTRTGLNAPYYTLGWTLNYEMFFYAVLACGLSFRSPALRFHLVLAILALLVLLRPVAGSSDPVLFRITSPLLLEFCAGMAIAYARQRRLVLSAAGALMALGLALAFLMLISSSHHETWPRIVYFGIPAALIVLGLVSIEDRLAYRPAAVLLTLGDASYSIYLSHDIVLKLLAVGLPGLALLHPVMAFTVVFTTAIVAGVVCYRRIERPLLHGLRDRLAFGRGRGRAGDRVATAAPLPQLNR
jgi:exopolysaccharide production protein ExoZ